METYREVATEDVVFLACDDLMKPTWDFPGSHLEGYRRGAARGIRSERVSIAVGLIPRDQGSPAHKSDAEHVFFGLAGELTFRFAGERYRLARGDTLYVAAGVAYEYANPGAEIAEFLDVVVRVGGWPASAQPCERPGDPRVDGR
jgi:quercetin dioxygenase-like cupin family protein